MRCFHRDCIASRANYTNSVEMDWNRHGQSLEGLEKSRNISVMITGVPNETSSHPEGSLYTNPQRSHGNRCLNCHWAYMHTKTKFHGLSPRANYADRATAACRRSACQLFADRGCHVVSVTDPYGRILGFLDKSRYFSIK
jgi:hypothetical protein